MLLKTPRAVASTSSGVGFHEFDENLISANQLAGKLGVSIRTIWRMDSSGKSPNAIRIGGSVRWNLNEINRWIKARCPDRLQWEAMESQAASRKDGGL
jgi:predicted DNA-binding transcriptional regulator AlpA